MIWFYLWPSLAGFGIATCCLLANYFDWKSRRKALMNHRNSAYTKYELQKQVSVQANNTRVSVIWMGISLLWPLLPFYAIYWLFTNGPMIWERVNKDVRGEFE